MKLLAAALTLVLLWLASVWLWLEPTATAEQDTPGVVITTAAPEGEPQRGRQGPSAEGNAALQREVDAAQAAERRAAAALALLASVGRGADQTVTAALSALGEATDEQSSGSAQTRAPTPAPATAPSPPPVPVPATVPQPVQPAPVSPGLCWDDDEWEECDDDGDDDWEDDDGDDD